MHVKANFLLAGQVCVRRRRWQGGGGEERVHIPSSFGAIWNLTTRGPMWPHWQSFFSELVVISTSSEHKRGCWVYFSVYLWLWWRLMFIFLTLEPTRVYSHWTVSLWDMRPFIPSTYSIIWPRAGGKETERRRERDFGFISFLILPNKNNCRICLAQ